MRKIRVTVGTVGYYDAKHAHKRMTAADGPFECEDTQADTSSLLVSLNTSAAQSK